MFYIMKHTSRFFSSDEYIELFDYLRKNGLDIVIENSDNLLYIEDMVQYILYDSEQFSNFRLKIKSLLFDEVVSELKKQAISKRPRIGITSTSDISLFNVYKRDKVQKIDNSNTMQRPLTIYTTDSNSIDSTELGDSIFDE